MKPVRMLLRGVKTHWNLHRKVWSVHRKGRPVRHMKSLTLVNAEFRVSQAGRKRAVNEGRRNVHAFAVGDVLGAAEPDLVPRMKLTPVSYNPFKGPSFYDKTTGDAVGGALMLVMTEQGSVFACQPTLEK